MVTITEIQDPDVRVVSGSWGIGADGSWIFIHNTHNATRRLAIREGERYSRVKEAIREAYSVEYKDKTIHLSYQWPDWMDMEAVFGGKTRPVPIETDETMTIFLAMRREIEDMTLYVSTVGIEGTVVEEGILTPNPVLSAAKGKAHVNSDIEELPDYEYVQWQKIMEDEAVLRWMRSTSSPGDSSDQTSRTDAASRIVNVQNAIDGPGSTSRQNNAPTRNLNCVEVDLLANLGNTSVNVAQNNNEGESDSESSLFFDANGNPREDAIKECSFFGPAANYMAAPIELDLDLRVPLQEALENMCLNFASFNRDAAPTLDDQGEEGIMGVELAVRDVMYEGDELFVGRVFKNKQDCNVKLAVHALNRRFHFRRDRSCKKLITLTCISESCPWRVYIAKLEDCDNYQIRSATLEHTCTPEERSNYHKQATTRVIASIMKSKYEGNTRGPRAIDLQHLLLSDHSVRISYWKAWKSREFAIDGAKGSAANSFTLLPAYLHVLKEANPGSVVELKTEIDAKGIYRFKYLFLAFAASIEGFQYMRRVIIIDGAHLKGKYGGCLLTASSQDANFQVYPLAFAIVDGENDDAWEWFFQVLKTMIPDDDHLTFVSDRHSSIYTGLKRVYPKAKHGACVVHLQRNIVSIFKKKHLAFHVSRAARAYRICDFHNHFSEITRLNKSCGEYLEAIGFSHWTRAYFLGSRYNVMTSNVAESLNAVLKEARELPILSILEFIRTTLMSWFAMRRQASQKEISALTPKMRELVHQNFEKSVAFAVKKVDRLEYEVKGNEGGGFHVNLRLRSCSCRAFDMLQLPCCHAIAAAVSEGIPLQTLIAHEYSVHNWRASYVKSIKPVPDVANAYPLPQPIASLQLFPPMTRRPPGRPKKKRIPSRGEYGRAPKQMTRCSRCTGAGHNRATCKMPI